MLKIRKIKTAEWMAAAFIVALGIVAVVYVVAVPSQRLGMALRATARWSFLCFCLATCGGALTTLFGSIFEPLARKGRDLGLAFAAAHSVHIALVVWLLYISTEPFPRVSLIVFSIGVFFVYLLAVISLSSTLSARLGPRRWKNVRSIGVEYIAFAYAFEFGGRILDGNLANAIHYFPLFAAAVGGPLLRMAAYVKRRSSAQKTAGLLPG
jgi:sulfoxide reductase heme-binding subunit YedZ